VGLVALAAGLGLLATLPPRTIGIVVAGAVLVGLTLAPPQIALLLLVATIPWEGFLHYPTQTITTVKVLGVVALASLLFRALAERRTLVFPPAVIAVLVFGLAVAASLMTSTDPRAGVAKAIRYELFVIFFFLVVQLTRGREDAVRLLKVFAGSATVSALVGLALLVAGVHDHARGPVSDPNDFAFVLATAVPVALFLARAGPRVSPMWALSAAILVTGVFGTLSRGGLVGLGALVLWGFTQGGTRRVAVLAWVAGTAVVLLVAIHFAAPALKTPLDHKSKVAHQNVVTRQALWRAAGDEWVHHPLLGVGPSEFGPNSDRYVGNRPYSVTGSPVNISVAHNITFHGTSEIAVHNSYLELLAENGALGLLAFVGTLALAFHGLVRRQAEVRPGSPDQRLLMALQGAFVVMAVTACFISAQVGFPFWFIGALATGVAYGDRRSSGFIRTGERRAPAVGMAAWPALRRGLRPPPSASGRLRA